MCGLVGTAGTGRGERRGVRWSAYGGWISRDACIYRAVAKQGSAAGVAPTGTKCCYCLIWRIATLGGAWAVGGMLRVMGCGWR